MAAKRARKRKTQPRRQRFIGFQTGKRPKMVPKKTGSTRALGESLPDYETIHDNDNGEFYVEPPEA